MLALAGVFGGSWAVSAWATPVEDLARCCDAESGGACPQEITAVGPGSSAHPSEDGVRVFGVWRLTCAGPARFDAGYTAELAQEAPVGTVLGKVSPAVAACFDAACALPEGVCLRSEGGAVRVRDCADGREPTVGMWSNPPRTPFGFGGRGTASSSPSSSSASGQQTVLASASVPSGSSSGSSSGSTGGVKRPPVVAPPVAAGQRGPVDASVPPAPPSPCVPPRGMRASSNAQVDAGNEALVQGDPSTALDRYRAAITIDRCNAFGWTALGDGLLALGSPMPARAALEAATVLMPGHYHAWTSLGEARERSGDRVAAAAAYQRALTIHPGHPPAVAGLGRVR